jgi:hypothetical protein
VYAIVRARWPPAVDAFQRHRQVCSRQGDSSSLSLLPDEAKRIGIIDIDLNRGEQTLRQGEAAAASLN